MTLAARGSFFCRLALRRSPPSLGPSIFARPILLGPRTDDAPLVYDIEDVALVALPDDVLAIRVHLRLEGAGYLGSLLVPERLEEINASEELR